jgi:hypothetical protein
MAEALLVSDQHIDESFLSSNSLTLCAQCASSLIDEQASLNRSATFTTGSFRYGTLLNLPMPPERTGSARVTGSSPAVAQRVFEQLAALRRDREMYRQAQDEIAWITENRLRFNGRWIALSGRNLLAVGDSAMEVFRETEHLIPPPLVVKLDEESLPFSGW